MSAGSVTKRGTQLPDGADDDAAFGSSSLSVASSVNETANYLDSKER